MDIIAFIILYFVSTFLSKYTMLSKYIWFNNLHNRILLSNSKYRNLYIQILNFKLFNCNSCNVFWISLALGFVVSISFVTFNYCLVALILYLFKKSEEV